MDSRRQQFFNYRRQLLKPISLHSVSPKPHALNKNIKRDSGSILSRIKAFVTNSCSKLASIFIPNQSQNLWLPTSQTRYAQSRRQLYFDLKNHSRMNSQSQYEQKLDQTFGEGYTKEEFNPFLVPRSRIGIKRPIDRRINRREMQSEEDFPASQLTVQIVNQYNKRQKERSRKQKSQRYNQLIRSNRTKKQFADLNNKLQQMQKTKTSKINSNTQVTSKRKTQKSSRDPLATHHKSKDTSSIIDSKIQNGEQNRSKLQKSNSLEKNQMVSNLTAIQSINLKAIAKELNQQITGSRQELSNQTQNQDEEKQKEKDTEDQKNFNQKKLITKSVNTNDQQTEKSSSLLSKIDRESVTLQNLISKPNQFNVEKKIQDSKKDDPLITQLSGKLQDEQLKAQISKSQEDIQETKQKQQEAIEVQKIQQKKEQSVNEAKVSFQNQARSSNLFSQSINPLSSVKKSGTNIFAMKMQQPLSKPLLASKIEKIPQDQVQSTNEKNEKKGFFQNNSSKKMPLFNKSIFSPLFKKKEGHQEKPNAQKSNIFQNLKKTQFPAAKDGGIENIFKISLTPSKQSPFQSNNSSSIFKADKIFDKTSEPTGLFQKNQGIKSLFTEGSLFSEGKKQQFMEKSIDNSKGGQEDLGEFADLFDEPSKKIKH